MQDINNDGTFDKKVLSFDEKNKKSIQQEVSTAFKDLDKSRKMVVIFLAFFSIFLFITWGVTTKNRINNPLKPEVSEGSLAGVDQGTDSQINIDTDGDGLTDWEEENLYYTSPFLEDTDSDGILDGVEVSQGSDPNCKEGEDCSVADSLKNEESLSQEIENLVIENLDFNINLDKENQLIDEDALTEALEGGSDAATLRKMLLDAGMEGELLNTISDEDLLSSYNQVLQ